MAPQTAILRHRTLKEYGNACSQNPFGIQDSLADFRHHPTRQWRRRQELRPVSVRRRDDAARRAVVFDTDHPDYPLAQRAPGIAQRGAGVGEISYRAGLLRARVPGMRPNSALRIPSLTAGK